MNIESIIEDHKERIAYTEYTPGYGSPYYYKQIPKGVPGTEIVICGSDNHYYDNNLVRIGDCHVRILLAEIERLRALLKDV